MRLKLPPQNSVAKSHFELILAAHAAVCLAFYLAQLTLTSQDYQRLRVTASDYQRLTVSDQLSDHLRLPDILTVTIRDSQILTVTMQ